MLFRRTVALLASLTLPLAACSAPAAAPRPAPSPSRPAFDGKASIAASLSGIDAGVYSFVLTTRSGAVNGILDAPGRSLETTSRRQIGDLDLEVTSRMLIIGDQQYLKVAARGADWDELLENIAKHRGEKLPEDVRETSELLGGENWVSVPKKPGVPDLTRPDALGLKALLSHVETTRGSSEAGNNRIAGTLDVSRLDKSPDLLGSMAKLSLPAKALAGKPAPYAAYLTHGRLTMLDLTMPGGAGHWLIEVNDYGTARPAPAPLASQVKKLSPDYLEPLTEGSPVRV
ncbi:hypothetical protein [Actinoplanes sp. NPDC049265]|uniref:hypothetical protein n=1 Tax=Actinoplanes sp. NPDC049265 TaxID=3363902 RepID=UPI0037137F49